MAKVAILMGSKSDFPVVRPAAEALKKFGVETEVRVISAHRTPDEAHAFAENAEKNGVEVVICAAGKAAHLGGVIAAYTTLPVIGLPVKTDMMGGLDSLLSIVQMPLGHSRGYGRRERRRKRGASGARDPRRQISRHRQKTQRIQGVHGE